MKKNINKLNNREKRILEFLSSKIYVPMTPKELAHVLEVPKLETDEFEGLINNLLTLGKIELTKKGRIIVSNDNEKDIAVGVLQMNSAGYGFVKKYEEDQEDIFIPPNAMKDAMNGDTVEVKVIKKPADGNRAVGEIRKILKENNIEIVGTYEKVNKYGFVVPDDSHIAKDIYIPKAEGKGVITGEKVLVKITNRKGKNPEGTIIKRIGFSGDKGVDITSIVLQNSISYEFPKEVEKEARAMPDSVLSGEINKRSDFRHLRTVTIDGEDTKDFDDAITIERIGDLFRLGVHIADVAHYVKEKSACDKEAYVRGNSVYLPDRVIPMLPFELSNGICSLVEGSDRLTLSAVMDVNGIGEVVNHSIVESVINVDKRTTYKKVTACIEDDPKAKEEYSGFLEMIADMEQLYRIVAKRRKDKGSIDFDMPECSVVLDSSGHCTDVVIRERNIASRIIEEFMILANETVSEEYFWREAPFLYRTHESPDNDEIKELKDFLRKFGYKLTGNNKGEIHPKSIQTILDSVKGTSEEQIISRKIIRTMKQARYSSIHGEHFGLSSKYYSHFTSPIRRYADLNIHRVIKRYINNQINDNLIAAYEERLSKVANRCSKMERVEEKIEREVEQMKKAEYMSDRIGQVFEGIISHTTSYGFYVELPNTVDGMVSLQSLEGYYVYDPENMRYYSNENEQVFELGQKLKIIVKDANVKERLIDFTLFSSDMQE